MFQQKSPKNNLKEIAMIKTLKHFSLLFVFIFSMVSAEIKEDRLYVTMVDPEFHCFALSNNMVCNIPQKNWETETLPEVGTEIYFYPFRLSNSENEDEIFVGYSQDPLEKIFNVWITPESKQYGVSCISSESICTAPAGYIFSGQYRDVLLLSDGSQWIKEKEGKTGFGPKSRLVVSKQKDGDYLIIDLDKSDFSCKCGAKTPYHRYEWVKPYEKD
jgi:hypothetical protein